MIALVPVVLVAGVGVAAWILELRGRQPRTTERSRGQLAGLAFLLGLVALVFLSPPIALIFERPLPVDPPVNPLAGEGCGDNDSGGAGILVIVLAIYFGARAGAGTIGALVRGLSAPPSHVVTGKPAMTVAAIFLGLIFPIVTVRILLPGPSPDDFATYGALTPDAGARGWRANLVLDGMRDGPLAELPRHPTSMSDIKEGGGGHGSFSTGPYLRSGIHGWVDGAPVLIFKPEGPEHVLVGAYVDDRSSGYVPPERRPRFHAWPQVAPHDDGWVLVERRRDGSTFAMRVTSYGDAETVDQRDIWALVRPSEIAHGIAFALFFIGLAFAYASLRRGNSPGFALVAAWLWLEAGALDLYYYAPVLGL